MMRLSRKFAPAVASAVCISALAVLAGWSPAAHALTISPVLVELSAARPIASITFTNRNDAPITFQTQALAWTQPEGIDRYDETDDLIVVPPIAEIAAGSIQIFRVTTRAPSAAREHAYKLVFEDITEAVAPQDGSAELSVSFRVTHKLPVFIAAAGKPRAEARLGACAAPALPNKGCIRIDNDGNRYAQVKSIAIRSGSWRSEINVAARVLAGAWHEWSFDMPDGVKGALEASADTRDGLLTAALPARSR